MSLDKLDFEPWLTLWALEPDGAAFRSTAGILAPVRSEGRPAMLKLTPEPEELRGGELMSWWGGQGAARVLARQGEALLLERATGEGDLGAMSRHGRDGDACRILCQVAADLHRPRPRQAPASLVPLETWFRALWPRAASDGGLFEASANAARRRLSSGGETVVLHGDLHHGNVLDFGARGWLVIDPKGLIGDRGYDYANMLCNPDAETALAPGVFDARLGAASHVSGLDRTVLAEWLLAYCGLSASWTLEGGPGDVENTLKLAEMAASRI